MENDIEKERQRLIEIEMGEEEREREKGNVKERKRIMGDRD